MYNTIINKSCNLEIFWCIHVENFGRQIKQEMLAQNFSYSEQFLYKNIYAINHLLHCLAASISSSCWDTTGFLNKHKGCQHYYHHPTQDFFRSLKKLILSKNTYFYTSFYLQQHGMATGEIRT